MKIDEAPANAGSARARAPVSARVLIVDDDPAMRTLCAVNLALEGLVVLEQPAAATASSGRVPSCPTSSSPM